MLSYFPQLLFLSPFAALLIRLALTAVFAYSAWFRFSSESTLIRAFAIIDAALAVMFFIGLSTQLAALAGAICTIYWLVRPDSSAIPRSTAALALVMCLSILVMGAGPFAYDLPL